MGFFSDITDSIKGGGSVLGGITGLFGDTESAGSVQNMADPYHRLRQKYMDELATYTDAGPSKELTAGTSGVMKALGSTSKGFTFNKDDPSYQFRLNQGSEAVARQMNAQGHNDSGNMWAALQDYGQQTASQEYGNAYQRWLGRNTLLSQLGTTAVGLDQQKLNNLMRLAQVDSSSAADGVKARQNENKFGMGVLDVVGNTLGSIFGG